MDFRGGNGSSSDGRLALAGQSSVYSLTFDEFQNTLLGGSVLGSMNMDELLKSIWTAEESQALAAAGVTAAAAAGPSGAPLQRQGSLTLPRTLSVKTVDEVWRDVVRDAQDNGVDDSGTVGGGVFPQQRQSTLGEMTLEEFLVRAGVVREDDNQTAVPMQMPTTSYNGNGNGNNMFFSGGGGAIGYTLPMGMPEQRMNTALAPLGGGGLSVVVEPSVNVNPMNVIGKGNGELVSPVQPVPYAFEGVLRGRRNGGTEKVVERRQRRMIKNRESAARSRARKQAYTMELEAEVAKLKEQNEALERKQAEILELQKKKVPEIVITPYVQKKRCLRRTLTGPW